MSKPDSSDSSPKERSGPSFLMLVVIVFIVLALGVLALATFGDGDLPFNYGGF